jgi:hypothetical protein
MASAQSVSTALFGDAVVHVHREHRERQREEVHQRRRPQHVAIDVALAEDGAPEPVRAAVGADLGRARVEAEVQPHEQRDAAVARIEVAARQAHGALAGLGQQHARGAGGVPAEQHAGALVLQHEDGRQRGAVDARQR